MKTKTNIATKQKLFRAALLGNPNSGKTMLFNALTGSNQYVGNWAGVTVEKKSGGISDDKKIIGELIDLPGIYSLSSYSLEEKISRDFILEDDPDLIVNILDGTNIERNLYLTIQALEIGKPTLVLVNMIDEVRKRGDRIDCDKLSKLLGVPVIPISAKQGENIDLAVKEMRRLAEEKPIPPNLLYDQTTYDAISKIQHILSEEENHHKIPFRFYAAKLLEDDISCVEKLELSDDQLQRIDIINQEYESSSKYGDRQTILSNARYNLIEQIVKKSVAKKQKPGDVTLSDQIDKIVLNRYLSYPIFLYILFVMFLVTFQTVGAVLQEWLQNLFDFVITPGVESFLTSVSAPEWTAGLLIDGVLGGVGAVISFVPLIALLFFFLSLMEDSGYMARAAFIMDKIFSKFGLSGRSFIPMIMGFGCSVPAIMAARTMDNEKDRRLTIILTPFMSCGAKLPVYALFASIFFPDIQGYVIFGMYIIGMIVAVLTGIILSKTVFKGDATPFIMELPPYRLPSLKSTLKLTWEKARDFLARAGTLIFAMSVLLWFLQAFNFQLQLIEDNSQSILAAIGMLISPIFIPLGFGTWQAAVSILSGFIAKEAVVSTMAVLYGAASDTAAAMTSQIQNAFTPASALSMMTFVLLCSPCIAACATIKREMNSWKWAFFTYGYQFIAAYIGSLIVYWVSSIFM